MMTTKMGVDASGAWTPAQYAIDMGWSFDCIVATAQGGVSETDAAGLTDTQQDALLAYCQERIADLAWPTEVV